RASFHQRIGEEEMRDDEGRMDLETITGMYEVVERVGIGDDELDVRKPRRAGASPRFLDQIGIAIDPDHPPGQRRKGKGNPSRPGPDVDDNVAAQRLVDDESPERWADAGWRYQPVTAPSDADDTRRAYFAMTPVV